MTGECKLFVVTTLVVNCLCYEPKTTEVVTTNSRMLTLRNTQYASRSPLTAPRLPHAAHTAPPPVPVVDQLSQQILLSPSHPAN